MHLLNAGILKGYRNFYCCFFSMQTHDHMPENLAEHLTMLTSKVLQLSDSVQKLESEKQELPLQRTEDEGSPNSDGYNSSPDHSLVNIITFSTNCAVKNKVFVTNAGWVHVSCKEKPLTRCGTVRGV